MTTEPLKLSEARAEAYREACADRGPIAFVAVPPHEDVPGINGALGVAIANERGYHPVPLGWARYATMDAAEFHAECLNIHLGVTGERAFQIIASTMGGKRFTDNAA